MAARASHLYPIMRNLSGIVGLLCLSLTAPSMVAQSSPFQRKPGPATAGAEAAKEQPFEFTGLVKMGSTPLVCVTELAEKRSHWIKVGQSYGGIAVREFDQASRSILIRHNGQSYHLKLVEPTFDPSKLAQYQPPAPSGPLPSAGVAPTVPLTNEEKATDARMLVSDLLEIGMIQRKAYENAKAEELAAEREAAQKN